MFCEYILIKLWVQSKDYSNLLKQKRLASIDFIRILACQMVH